MNETVKAAQVSGQELTPEHLALINKHTTREFTEDELFTFKATLCDNEVDRDGEAFSLQALEKMAGLFLGKTIIADHNPKAENQRARIYHTEVVKEGILSSTGESYARLVAHCYLARVESNKDFITEIEAGIRKELSVGCQIERAVCSVCGNDKRKTYCKHQKGETYGGKTCYVKLENPQDAYEVSFVAVPAQPAAGVTKQYGGEENQPEKAFDGLDSRLLDAFLFIRKDDEHE